ncbi:MAG: DUF58 domain-containing protein [Ruminococcaceae bacterium]|nr:DUF58 domain-containing protein [Oscillospiraceae bacterium]
MIALLLHWVVYLLTLAGMCAFAVNYTAWFSSFLFYTVLLLPVFSLLLSLWPFLVLRLSFTAPMQVHRGDTAELNIMAAGTFCPYYLPVTLTVTQTDLSQTADRLYVPPKAVRYQFAPYPVILRRNGRLLPHFRAAGGIRIPVPTEHTAVIRTEIRTAFLWDFLGLFRLPVHLSERRTGRKTKSADIVVLPHTNAPKGKLRMWDNSQSTLTPTQRPTEQYEIRTYRPGDPLRSVHWKLTAKIDDILVREPVEPQYQVLAIALERVRDPAGADLLYDALDWMLRALCVREHVRSVVVGWITADGRTCTETLYDLSRLDDFYRRMLSDTVPEQMPPHAFASVYKSVDRGYHLDTETCLGTGAPITVTNAGNEPYTAELTV